MTPATSLAPAPPSALRADTGEVLPLRVDRWLDAADECDESVLADALAPVLDIGCGPGRHVLALGRRGVMALGVDVSLAALQVARSRGALALERSVFDRVPGAGRWGSALLLDGSVGIGGDPVRLLRRVAHLLRPRGRCLVEVAEPGLPTRSIAVRVEAHGRIGPWFRWAEVGVDDIASLAAACGFSCARRWTSGGRWFVRIDRP